MKWIISANSKYYDHKKSFDDFDYIDWKQTANYSIGDIVYIYSTRPDSKISFITKVEKTNLSFSQIRDDKKYWADLTKYEESKTKKFVRLRLLDKVDDYNITLEKLLENGLNAAPQGPVKVRGKLFEFLDNIYNLKNINKELDNVNTYLEGEEQSVLVTKYERNPEAREKCLDYYGYSCKGCGFNFEAKYGDVGKKFIHVHHLIPISEIKERYIINPIKDLIPVCPNCHAMLHRKQKDGTYISYDELKNLILK